jgi:hypothetical protein
MQNHCHEPEAREAPRNVEYRGSLPSGQWEHIRSLNPNVTLGLLFGCFAQHTRPHALLGAAASQSQPRAVLSRFRGVYIVYGIEPRTPNVGFFGVLWPGTLNRWNLVAWKIESASCVPKLWPRLNRRSLTRSYDNSEKLSASMPNVSDN